MQQWEYCAISFLELPAGERGPLQVRYPVVERFSQGGGELEGWDIDGSGWADISERIFQLGEQGWEMVGCSDTESYHVIYFECPKQ